MCNRFDFVLERVRNRDVLSVGLGGVGYETDFSFQVAASTDLSWTISSRIAECASSAAFVDIFEPAIETFRGRIDAEFFCANVCAPASTWPDELRIRDFDAVVLGEVLEHLDSPGPALRSLRTLLRPGGVMLITVPNTFALSRFARMARGDERVHPEHVAYYSPSTLARLVAMCDMRLLEIGFCRTRPLHVRQLFSRPLGYMSGLVAERLPQYGQGVVATAAPK